MNLPNKLTMLRILIIPVMLVIAFVPFFNDNFIWINDTPIICLANLINLFLFIGASLTDLLDGKIARKRNLVTTFGKFADPIADKLLVLSAMIILMVQFVDTNNWWFLPAWVVIIILAREFIVSGIRLVAVEKGKVIAAGWLGKIKTSIQMSALIALFLHQVPIFGYPIFGYIGAIGMYGALIMTIWSGADYFIKSKDIILKQM